MSAAADAGAALLARAEAAVNSDPDHARELLVEAAHLMRDAGSDAHYAQACELMGWIAIDTGDLALAVAPLEAALQAHEARADHAAAARVAAMLAFLAAPAPFAGDADAMAAEAELAAGLFQYPDDDADWRLDAVAWRAHLDLQRRVPMRTGTLPRLRLLERALALDPLSTAMLAAAAAPALSQTAALALRATQGHPGAPATALLRDRVATAFLARAAADPLAAAGPLRRYGLLRPGTASITTSGMATAEIDTDALAYLCGAPGPAAVLHGRLGWLVPGPAALRGADAFGIGPEMRALARQGHGRIALSGAQQRTEAAAADLARAADLELLHVRLDGIAGTDEHVRTVQAAAREARLAGAAVALDWAHGPVPAVAAHIRPVLDGLAQPIHLLARRAESLAPLLVPADIALHFPEGGAMTGHGTDQHTDRLLTQARDLVLRGAFDEAAPMYEEGGRRLLDAGNQTEAVEVLVAASRLRAMLGELDAAARHLDHIDDLARHIGKHGEVARARAEIADQQGDAEARGQAWQAVLDSGDESQRLHALLRLADVARAQEDPARVAGLLTEALAHVPATETAAQADVHIERAVALCALGRHDQAEAALRAAENLAGDAPVLHARIAGQRGVIALAQDDVEQALVHGEVARTRAVAATDVPTYLAANMLIYMAHRQAGDPLRAYDTLLRARVSLDDLVGPDGAQLVQPALDAFAEQLGAEEFDDVHERWAAWRRAQQPA